MLELTDRLQVSEQQEAVEVNKYPDASAMEYHVYDAKKYFAQHPESAAPRLLFKFYPQLKDLTNKLVATMISLHGSGTLSMQVIESEYQKLFREQLDPSLYHFNTLCSLIKVLMEKIAGVLVVMEKDHVKQNHCIFVAENGLRTWIAKKWSETDGLETVKQILLWSRKFLLDECVILPPTSDYKDCPISEKRIPEEGLTSPDGRINGAEIVWHSVVISAVSSPRSFYVNLGKDRQSINEMADELERFYNPSLLNSYGSETSYPYSKAANGTASSYDVPDFLIRPGMVVAAKFVGDQTYQRALVMNCDNLSNVSVRYVDYGGSGNFELKSLRLMNKHFIEKYPEAFSIKVALFGICPPIPIGQDRLVFPADARKLMIKYSDHEKKIAGAFMTRQYVNPPRSGLEGLRVGRVLYECFLCDVTKEGDDLYIHDELVNAGYASRLPSRYGFPILNGLQTEDEVYRKILNKQRNHRK